MLAWGSRRLWGARKLEKTGLPASEVCKQLRVSDFFADKFLGQVRQFSDSEMERNHRLILEADIASKSGQNPEVVLDQLIVQLCR
jgi:DNA polymerase III delta subunit